MRTRRWAAAAALLLAVVLTLGCVLAAIAWQSIAARDDEWSHRLRWTIADRTIERHASVTLLLRAATHPLAAPLLHGRTLDTTQGRWLLAAKGDGSLAAQCGPCAFNLAALGPQPLRVERAELALHADGVDRYHGTLTVGRAPATVTLAWRGGFDRAGRFSLDANLPPTPLAHVVHALGSELPERDTVQVAGRLSLGYHFRILTAQGPAAPGGDLDYLKNGEMSGGFALVAWPAQYDATGIMTFIVSGDGVVLEKDLGPETPASASAITRYDPDDTWRPAQAGSPGRP